MHGYRLTILLVAAFLSIFGIRANAEPGRADETGAILASAISSEVSSDLPVIGLNAFPKHSTAVVICSGGSYFWRSNPAEGEMVVKWLQKEGMYAKVLNYTVGGWWGFTFYSRALSGRSCFPAVLDEIRTEVSSLRTKGFSRVGVLGFSAGGHLALLGAEYARNAAECPDFVAALYPVVTMSDEGIVHKRSRRGLMGEKMMNDNAMRDSLSLEKHIPDDMPPVFLLCCDDDPVVNPANSRVMDEALCKKAVPHKFIELPGGGHGFGADSSRFNKNTSSWQSFFIDWLDKL